MPRCARACAWGGGSIVNAIALGIGASFPLSLKVVAEVCEGDGDAVSSYADIDLSPIYKALEILRARFKFGGVAVRFSGDLPTAGGLKSSSAALNSLILALNELFGLGLSRLDVARLNAEISKAVGISVTGAFDDATASALGEAWLTDNGENALLRKLDVSGAALVLIPPWGKGRGRLEEMRAVAPAVRAAVLYALRGDWRTAMAINAIAYGFALGYDPAPTIEALRMGAVGGVSGTGPSHVFVADDIDKLYSALSRYGRLIRAEIPSGPCAIT
ncbi:MAG: shikimate kinase [Thermoproteus sp.]